MRRLMLSALLLMLLPIPSRGVELAIPMHRDKTGQLSVSMTINGKPARLLVDTGANVSTLDRARGEAYFPGTLDPAPSAPGAPPQVDLPVGAGSLAIGNERFTVLNLSFINVGAARMGTPPFDGQLGASFFQQYHAVIDFPAMILKLDVPGPQAAGKHADKTLD